jgi:hypothetical protein
MLRDQTLEAVSLYIYYGGLTSGDMTKNPSLSAQNIIITR